MKKIVLFAALLCSVLLSGCMDVAMKYTPSDELEAQYKDRVRDEYLTIYYNVQDTQNGRVLMMAIKNTGNIFVQNLSFNYDFTGGNTSTYTYKSVGNLKNRSSKVMSILLPKDCSEFVTINYMFTPVVEDAFLNRDAQTSFPQVEPIKGTLKIYLPK